MRIRHIVFTLIGFVLAAPDAFAQEQGRLGLSAGYPQIGVLWHITDRIAIRPGVSFEHGSSDLIPSGTIVQTATTDSTVVGLRVDALLAVGAWDNVHAYVAPGYEYARSSSTHTTSTMTTASSTDESNVHEHRVSGVFGVRYVPHPRFGVFGEAGLRYSTSSGTTFGSTLKSRFWDTTTGAGVIFYF
jgi:hypothetical protein